MARAKTRDQTITQAAVNVNVSTIFEFAMLLSGSSVLTAVAESFLHRRKVKIDATSVLSDVSIKQVNAMQKDLASAKDQMRQFQEALYRHQRWDQKVILELNKLGVDMGEPPELWL